MDCQMPEMQDCGGDCYLAKPSKPVLLAQVASFVKPGSAQQPPFPEAGPAALGSPPESPVDASLVAELRALSDDEDFLAELVSQFVADTDASVDQLRAALEAGDISAAATLAHSIKGSSGTVGGWRPALACGRLEARALSGHLIAARGELGEVANEYQELRRTWAGNWPRRPGPERGPALQRPSPGWERASDLRRGGGI